MFLLLTRGGPIMYVLLGFSIVSLAIIMERALFWIRIRRQGDKFTSDIIKKTISFYQEAGQVSSDKLLEAALAVEMPSMRRYLDILDTIITAAPLLGILGTVVGIINAFGFLGPSGGDPRAVSGGISVALLTTAAGLVVALISLIPYNYFNSRIEEAVTEIEKAMFQLHMRLEGNGEK